MEKNQYELCAEILRKLDKAGILKHVILIGSWCVPFYAEYFRGLRYIPDIKTRDMDFLVPIPLRIETYISIPELLKDIGFVIGFKGAKGYMKFEHPDLVVEFLVPERGGGIDGPYLLPKLGINAVALRFLDFLINNPIKVKVENFFITLPHPANFALHKLIIFQRRTNKEKAEKDRDTALRVLKALIAKGEENIIKKVFDSINKKWRDKIIMGLEKSKEKDILKMLCE